MGVYKDAFINAPQAAHIWDCAFIRMILNIAVIVSWKIAEQLLSSKFNHTYSDHYTYIRVFIYTHKNIYFLI